MITHMTGDSKPFSRTFRKYDASGAVAGSTTFKGCMGVCLTIEDKNALVKEYARLLEEVFKKTGEQREKISYSSHEISEMFATRRGDYLDALEAFVVGLGKMQTLRINFVFTVLNTLTLTQGVKYYGLGRSPVKSVPPLDFLDALNNYYPYVCAWKVAKAYKIAATSVVLDSFLGEVTLGWGELCAHHKVTVFPSGDLCNPLISAADICVRYFDERLSEDWKPLSEPSVNDIILAKGIQNGHVFHVGNLDLPSIAPIEKRLISLDTHYPRPMIFILKEGVMQGEIEYVRTRKPLMRKIEKFASEQDTGYKFIDYGKDHELLRDEDIVICLGDRGKEQYKYLSEIGYKLKIVTLADL